MAGSRLYGLAEQSASRRMWTRRNSPGAQPVEISKQDSYSIKSRYYLEQSSLIVGLEQHFRKIETPSLEDRHQTANAIVLRDLTTELGNIEMVALMRHALAQVLDV